VLRWLWFTWARAARCEETGATMQQTAESTTTFGSTSFPSPPAGCGGSVTSGESQSTRYRTDRFFASVPLFILLCVKRFTASEFGFLRLPTNKALLGYR